MSAFTPEHIAESFALGTPREDLQLVQRGQSNTFGVCRLRTDQGAFAVKRFSSAPRPVALLIEAAAYEAGAALPRPVVTRQGAPYCKIADARWEVWVRVHEWIDGTPLDWGHVRAEDSFSMGRFMASVHGVAAADLSEARPIATSPTADEWTDLATRAQIRQLPWADTLRKKLPVLLEHQAYISAMRIENEPLVASQQDLHPPNVIRTPNGELIVVDWDSAAPVVASHDVAKYALVWATAHAGEPDVAAVHAFIDGYREGGGVFESRGRVELTHQLETYLSWLVFNIRRDVSTRPGPDATLTPALLSGVGPLDIAGLDREAALLDH